MKALAVLYALIVVFGSAILFVESNFDSLVAIFLIFPTVGCVGLLGYVFKRRILNRTLWRFIMSPLIIEIVLVFFLTLFSILENGFHLEFLFVLLFLTLLFLLIRVLKKYNSSSCLIWLNEEEITKGKLLSCKFATDERIEGVSFSIDDDVVRYDQITVECKPENFHVELLRIRQTMEECYTERFENFPAVVHYIEQHTIIGIDSLKCGEYDLVKEKSDFIAAMERRFPTTRDESLISPISTCCSLTPSDRKHRIRTALLWSASGAMGLCGGLMLCLPFVLSMAATDLDILATNSKAMAYRDLESGQFRCWNDGFDYSEAYVICMYHRKSEQIKWLKTTPVPAYREPSKLLRFEPHLRSIRAEYFVFSVSRYRTTTHCNKSGVCTNTSPHYLPRFLPLWSYGWDRYTDMVFFSDGLEDYRLHDGIYFSINNEYLQSKPILIYDLAGRMQHGWPLYHNEEIDALSIPPYYFDEENDLIFGYSTAYSYANRFRMWLKGIRV